MSDLDSFSLHTDPLSDLTRNERRNLLFSGTLVLLVSYVGIIPSKIGFLGVEFPPLQQRAFIGLLGLVTLYFLLAFIVYGSSDFLAWRKRYQDYLEQSVRAADDWSEEDQREFDELSQQVPRADWIYTGSRYMSIGRIIFELLIPAVFGVATLAFAAGTWLTLSSTPAPQDHRADNSGEYIANTLNKDHLRKLSPIVELENSIGMRFRRVPHTKVFFCIHETRNVDYMAFKKANGVVNREWETWATNQRLSHPAIYVNWDDAQKFCQWLSLKEKRTYRLPTDHEWSLAVGGLEYENEALSPNTKSDLAEKTFPWGGSFPPASDSGNYSTAIVDGYEDTAPVMQFRPNEYGLYDMGGNVCEWCRDILEIPLVYRVLRGGAWDTGGWVFLRSGFRSGNPPSVRSSSVGFRCVLESDQN